MIKPEAFIAIEESLAAALTKAVRSVTKKLYQSIDTAAADGDWGKVESLLGSISFQDLFDDLEPYLTYQTNVAMLFGASRVTGDVGTSSVGLGFEKLTTTQVVANFRQVLRNAEEYVRSQGLQLIALNKEQQPEQVQKAEKSPVLTDFSSFLNDKGEVYMNIVASLHTSRVSAYGFTAEAHVLGLEEYQIDEQLDNRICPVCKMMHGKTFKVADARSLLNVVTRATDPDDLKSLQPWPKQDKESLEAMAAMSTAELVANGWHIPPFHPGCRGLLGRVGTVNALQTPDVDTDYTAISDDFKNLGITLSRRQLAQWNDTVKLPPSTVLSTMSGAGEPEIIQAGMEDNLEKDLGLYSLMMRKDKVSFIMSGPMYGKEKVSQIVSLDNANKEVSVSSDYIGSNPTEESVKKYLKSMYLLAKDIGYGKVNMSVADKAPYWVQMGFYPSTSKDWDYVKNTLAGRYLTIENLSDDAKEVVEQLIASDNPSDLKALLSLNPDIVDTLIGDTVWGGSLTLSDKAAVKDFISNL